MAVTSEEYRNVLRHFPSGVTIVTIRSGEEIHGLTVSAFASITPQPPLVMISIDHRHSGYQFLEEEDAVFAVNILHQSQTEMSNRFAWMKDVDRFDEGQWITAATGAPILADALAWLDCTIYDRFVAGGHTLYIGEVQACDTPRAEQPPLVYWNRGYRSLLLHEEKTTRKER